MKILILIIALTLFCSKVFCQNINREVANIKAYVCNVDTNKKLYLQGIIENNANDEHSIHNTINYMAYDKPYAPRKKVKTVITGRTISSFYFKDDSLVYLKEIIPAHDNYAEVVEAYYKNDSVIFSKASFCKERILQIEYWSSGGMRIQPYSLKITPDSITYTLGGGKPECKNSKTVWNSLNSTLNLTVFDGITSGPLRAYIDGIDVICTITTNIRIHSFSNAYFYDKSLTTLATFINQIQQVLQSFHKEDH